MKAVFRKIITFFLAGVVFISSSGFGLIDHFCFMNGKKSTALYEKQGCCVKKKSAATHGDGIVLTSGDCCAYDTHFLTIDAGPVIEKVSSYFINALQAVFSTIISFFHATLQSNDAAFSATDSSPPLTGRDILIRYHILLI